MNQKNFIINEARYGDTGKEIEMLQMFLARIGFIDWSANAPAVKKGIFDNATQKGLEALQKLYKIEITGELDHATLSFVNMPRCGVSDSSLIRGKANFHSRWIKSNLSYSFFNFTNDLSVEDIRDAIKQAFSIWSEHSCLIFREVPYGAGPDIVIGFFEGDHGDGAPFDGVGPILAHAFYPDSELSGDAHFDEAQIWRIELEPGTFNIISVAAHEFGHSLGLEHSSLPDALMYPYYRAGVRELHTEDINRIQFLYPQSFQAVVKGNIAGSYSSQRHHSELFYVDDNDYLNFWYVQPGWNRDDSSFKASKVDGSISAVYSPSRDHSEVFFRGEDRFLHYYFADPHWTHDGTNLRAIEVDGAISAVFASQRNHSEVFFRGEDGYLHYYFAAPHWIHDGTNLRAIEVDGAISAVFSEHRRHSEVFFRGIDGYLHYYFAAPYWTHDGANLRAIEVDGAISAVYSQKRTHSEVFFRGKDGYLHYYFAAPHWTHDGANLRAIEVDGAISAVYSKKRNHSEVFFRGVDGFLHYYYVENNRWYHDGESFRGIKVDGDIFAVYSENRKHSEVFFRGIDGKLHYFYVYHGYWQHDC